MQFITLAATALFATTALAAPMVSKAEARTVATVLVSFQGAAGAHDDQYVPIDGTAYPVHSVLSISHIAVSAPSNVECTAYGIDDSVTCISGYETVDVGPPQEQATIVCTAY